MSNRRDFNNINNGSIVDTVTAPPASETVPEDMPIRTQDSSPEPGFNSTRAEWSSTERNDRRGETMIDDSVGSGVNYNGSSKIRPRRVVGWLVGIAGVCRGIDYRLHEGKNYIGRSPSCEVNVEDMKVSAGNVAQIVFDPRSKVFFSSDCDGTGTLSYLNGEPLMGRSTLKIYDRFEIGDCVFLFVPLCGEAFSWDQENTEK